MARLAIDEGLGLGQRQLFILPNRYGWLLAVILVVLLVASVNYGSGLGYALTFWLAATAVVGMLHTQRNLLRLRLLTGPSAAVFAGGTAVFRVGVANAAPHARYGIAVRQHGKTEVARLDIGAHATHWIELGVPAVRRGYVEAPVVTLSTEYPLGIFYCWSRRLQPRERCLVYPQPAPDPAPVSAGVGAIEGGVRTFAHGDDFVGQRPYRRGDSPRQVDWRALARGQGWYTKEWGGGAAAPLWLAWEELAGDVEERLARLCRGVLDAEAAGRRYGLRLPGTVLAPANGVAHRADCLRALALYGLTP